MVSNQVLVAALRIDLCCEAVGISITLATASTSHDNRESSEGFADGAGLEPAGHSQVAPISVGFELAVGAVPKCMYNAFWCTLSIEVQYLLSNCRVFEQVVSTWLDIILAPASIMCHLSRSIHIRPLEDCSWYSPLRHYLWCLSGHLCPS
jgi:hypothetical protein